MSHINILGLTELYNNMDKPTILNNSSFFYISKDKKVIPWYNIFPYYFFIIDNKKYIHDFEFKLVMEFFKNLDNIKNEEHIDLLNNKDFTILELDKVIFIKHIHTNAGHAFGNIMNTIYKLKNIDLSNYNY